MKGGDVGKRGALELVISNEEYSIVDPINDSVDFNRAMRGIQNLIQDIPQCSDRLVKIRRVLSLTKDFIYMNGNIEESHNVSSMPALNGLNMAINSLPENSPEDVNIKQTFRYVFDAALSESMLSKVVSNE